jgi:LmbE family N-acetylglucosaminyl deacetylase
MEKKKVILAAYAHPDDGEFLAGGTLAKWAEEGHQVYVICATNGNLGTKNLTMTKEKLADVRKEELNQAMEIIGGKSPIFLGFDDGFLRESMVELKEKLVYWFRKLQPDWIITFDPWKAYEIHPDHIEVGRIASEAAVFSCFPLLYPEHLKKGLRPHQPEEVWYMTPMEHKPNRLIDISTTFEKKIKAILCHQSQVEMLADMFVTGADPTNLTDEQKEKLHEGTYTLMQMASQALGSLSEGKVELAEAFYAIKVGAGHFDNYQDFLQEMIGMATDDLLIM